MAAGIQLSHDYQALRAEIERIRHRYQLRPETEAELAKHKADTVSLSVQLGIPLKELEWLRHEAVYHADEASPQTGGEARP